MSSPSKEDGTLLRVDIRAVGIDNWSEIRGLHAAAFKALAAPFIDRTESDAYIGHIYAPDYTDTLMALDLQAVWLDGRIVATAGWAPSDDRGETARISSVFVSPLFARLGIGRQVVSAAETRARTAGFGTFAVRAFQPSTYFFEALGYARSAQGVTSVGTENGIPVVFMRKHGDGRCRQTDERVQALVQSPEHPRH